MTVPATDDRISPTLLNPLEQIPRATGKSSLSVKVDPRLVIRCIDVIDNSFSTAELFKQKNFDVSTVAANTEFNLHSLNPLWFIFINRENATRPISLPIISTTPPRTPCPTYWQVNSA